MNQFWAESIHNSSSRLRKIWKSRIKRKIHFILHARIYLHLRFHARKKAIYASHKYHAGPLRLADLVIFTQEILILMIRMFWKNIFTSSSLYPQWLPSSRSIKIQRIWFCNLSLLHWDQYWMRHIWRRFLSFKYSWHTTRAR